MTDKKLKSRSLRGQLEYLLSSLEGDSLLAHLEIACEVYAQQRVDELLAEHEAEAARRMHERCAAVVNDAWTPREEWRSGVVGVGWSPIAEAVAHDIAMAIHALKPKTR